MVQVRDEWGSDAISGGNGGEEINSRYIYRASLVAQW